MHDPIPAIPWLSEAVTPFAKLMGFTTLPLHIHEVVVSFIGYHIINVYLAPAVSRWLFPVKYPALSAEKQFNWNVHCVSLCQSTMINVAALYVMIFDDERKQMGWQQRIWGYTGASGMIQGLAAGYFVWDLFITLRNIRMFGVGMLAHAVSAVVVFSFGFRPFVNFYASTFILYELSSPFLNFHWFFDKLGLTGSRFQLYNGIMLLVTFFSCRLVWGTYQSLRVYQDVWRALHHTPSTANLRMQKLANGTMAMSSDDVIMRFAGEEFVPFWLAIIYLGSNLVLNTLNFYWFGLMVEAIRKRFVPEDETKQEKASVMKSTQADGSVKVDVDQTAVRRRKEPNGTLAAH